MRGVDDFFDGQEEPVRSCLLAMRGMVMKFNDNMTEHWKYNMPCYCYNGKMFCYLWIDKKTKWPYILMVEGSAVSHPSLFTGSRKRMKILMIDPSKDLPAKLIKSIFNQALKAYV